MVGTQPRFLVKIHQKFYWAIRDDLIIHGGYKRSGLTSSFALVAMGPLGRPWAASFGFFFLAVVSLATPTPGEDDDIPVKIHRLTFVKGLVPDVTGGSSYYVCVYPSRKLFCTPTRWKDLSRFLNSETLNQVCSARTIYSVVPVEMLRIISLPLPPEIKSIVGGSIRSQYVSFPTFISLHPAKLPIWKSFANLKVSMKFRSSQWEVAFSVVSKTDYAITYWAGIPGFLIHESATINLINQPLLALYADLHVDMVMRLTDKFIYCQTYTLQQKNLTDPRTGKRPTSSVLIPSPHVKNCQIRRRNETHFVDTCSSAWDNYTSEAHNISRNSSSRGSNATQLVNITANPCTLPTLWDNWPCYTNYRSSPVPEIVIHENILLEGRAIYIIYHQIGLFDQPRLCVATFWMSKEETLLMQLDYPCEVSVEKKGKKFFIKSVVSMYHAISMVTFIWEYGIEIYDFLE
uniref:M4 protein n=1 Tax=Murid herpesvirus 4 TaxID=33708 RepID=C9DRI3_MHV68|nr:M4 protein [Murid gammaherpesvirus 4]